MHKVIIDNIEHATDKIHVFRTLKRLSGAVESLKRNGHNFDETADEFGYSDPIPLRKALRDIGYIYERKHKKVQATKKQVEETIQHHLKGGKVKDKADEFGMSDSWLGAKMREAGYSVKHRKFITTKPPTKYNYLTRIW